MTVSHQRRKTSFVSSWRQHQRHMPEALVSAMAELSTLLKQGSAGGALERGAAIARVRQLLNAATVQVTLDARDEGATMRQTAAALGGNHTSVREWLTEADTP